MDIFGDHWTGHWGKIKNDWLQRVEKEDIVLIPGDISWAMTIDEAVNDLNSIGELPGIKIMIRGNHDYWWTSISKVRQCLMPNFYAIQNDCVVIDDFCFVGTRGWVPDGNRSIDVHDEKIIHRECERLKLSLSHAPKDKRVIAMLHYPPINERKQPTKLLKLLTQYHVTDLVYGHLHGQSAKQCVDSVVEDIQLHLVSCDRLDFLLKKIV